MPSRPVVLSVTGLSSTSGYAFWAPDYYVRPFNIGIACVASSSGTPYSIEHTMDYTGTSTFISSNATWFQNSTIALAQGNLTGNYAFPVSMIRLNVVSGSSQTTVTATLIQAG